MRFWKEDFSTLDNKGSRIHLAKSAKVFISDDGQNFQEIHSISAQEIFHSKGKVEMEVGIQSARFVKVWIENAGLIPAGFPGAGSGAWLFVDEIGIW